MLGTMASWLSSIAEYTIRLDGPPPPEREAELRQIIDVFFVAHHGTLRGWDRERLRATALEQPWPLRLFYWEGHAFGCAMRRALGLTRAHPVEQNQAPGYRYMLYTGTGFYNGLARTIWMPRVDLDDPRWADEPDYHAGRALTFGGETFGVGLRRPDLDAALATVGGASPGGMGLAMGLGRVLWFHYAWRFDRLAAIIAEHPAMAEELALGLGVAMTYTQLTWPERIPTCIASMPETCQPWLRRGARLALAAGTREGEDFAAGLRALPDPLATWLREGEAAMATVVDSPDFAAQFRAAMLSTDLVP